MDARRVYALLATAHPAFERPGKREAFSSARRAGKGHVEFVEKNWTTF
jgi:hypothetical protein